MKKSILRNIIKEDILNFMEQEKGKKTVTIPSQLKTLVKELDPNIDIQILSMVLGKISQGKEKNLNIKEKTLLSEIFITLMKNKDTALGQRFLSIFKQIK